MKFTGPGNPAGLSPYGQSSACTARKTAPMLLACSAAHFKAAFPDGESSSPTTISFFIPHLHRAGPPLCARPIVADRVVGAQLRWSPYENLVPHPCRGCLCDL